MSDKVWIRIAKDPLDRDLVNAMSLGEHGTAFAGYAIDVPEDFFDSLGNAKRYFEVLNDDEVTEEEKQILVNNRSRNAAFLAEAKRNQQLRQQKQNARIVQAAIAAAAVVPAMTDDFPDSDDD